MGSQHDPRSLDQQLTELERIYDTLPIGLCSVDTTLRYTRINECLAEVNRKPVAAHLGRTIADVNPQIAPVLEPILRRVLETGEPLLNVPAAPWDDLAVDQQLVASYYPIEDDDGKVIGVTAVVQNAYEAQTDDETRKKTASQLRQSQKLEAVGRLAGGVAHDFNNLLMVIIGYSEHLVKGLHDRENLQASAQEIWNTAERAAALTRHLLAFCHKRSLQPKILDVNVLIQEMQKMLRRLVREDIGISLLLDPSAGRVEADPGQLEQVLVNLVVNAADAMPNGGKIVIETANVDLDESYTSEHLGARPGRYVRLAVSDTGHGMDERTRARVFEPFFTTKGQDRGTGLGLSTVYGIVKQSGGNIWVYSEPGRGTTFKTYFPRIDKAAELLVQNIEPVESSQGTETVLLVEDDDRVRALVRDVLRAEGYAVLEARRPREALLLCEQHEGPIHLLLTDVVMPEMSGRELAERVMSIRRETKMLYMSGYTAEAIVDRGGFDASIAFVEKPISPRLMARKVRQVLGTSIVN